MPKDLNREFEEFVAEVFGPLDPGSEQYRNLKMTFFAGVALAVRDEMDRVTAVLAQMHQFADELTTRGLNRLNQFAAELAKATAKGPVQ